MTSTEAHNIATQSMRISEIQKATLEETLSQIKQSAQDGYFNVDINIWNRKSKKYVKQKLRKLGYKVSYNFSNDYDFTVKW